MTKAEEILRKHLSDFFRENKEHKPFPVESTPELPYVLAAMEEYARIKAGEESKISNDAIIPSDSKVKQWTKQDLIDYCYEFAWRYGRYYHFGDSDKILARINEVFQLPEEVFADWQPLPLPPVEQTTESTSE